MKNKNHSPLLNFEQLDYEYKLFKNLTNGLCCSLERISDFFEQLSEEQKSKTLKEIENTRENICAISNLLSCKKDQNI